MQQQDDRLFGKYRGKVTSTKDPLKLGRIQVQVPSVFADGRANWAMPCTPYAGKDIGFFTVPPIESNVWIEFEAGNREYPIWSGCFWGDHELPEYALVEEQDKVQIFRTQGMTITLNNAGLHHGLTNGLTIEVESDTVDRKLKMIFDGEGIEINNKDETTIKIRADTIELDNRGSSTITIAQDYILSKESAVEFKQTTSTIELINSPSTIKMTTSNIESAVSQAKVQISFSGVDIQSGGAGKINVGLANTSIN
jgi:uncharacterized protein involved in type VI secretion and phage assembly